MSKIFLLEDDLSLINGLSFAFKKQGFELNIARTLKEAEELWTDGKYDLLVLDVSLPDGSGFEFCKAATTISQSRSNWGSYFKDQRPVSPRRFFSGGGHGIAVEWHQGSFAARAGFQKWYAAGFDRCGIQAVVLVYAKPEHGADKGANFR